MKLANRMIVVSLAGMMPLAAFEAYNAYSLHESRRNEVHAEAIRQAQLTASDIERILEGIWGIAKTVSQAPIVKLKQSEMCSAYISRVLPEVPYITSIATTDAKGTIVCSTNYLPSISIGERNYFKDALKSKQPVAGEYIIGKVSKVPLLPLAIGMKDDAGQESGVAVATLNLAWLSEHLKQRGLPIGGSVTIADRKGVILARQPFPEKFVGTSIPDEYKYLMLEKVAGSLEVKSQDGTTRILGFVPITASPSSLYVSVGLSTEASFAALTSSNWRQVGIWTCVMVLSLLGARIAGRHLVLRLVQSVVDASRKLRGGDLSARTGLSAQDGELGQIGEEFDHTTAQLQRRDQTIKVLMRELEHRGKNQIAVIMSLAAQQSHRASTIKEYQKGLTQRLAGLSTSYDLLLNAQEGEISLQATIAAQLRAFGFDTSDQVSFGGPEIKLFGTEVRMIGMAVHELMTNTLKYGALSTKDGKVSIDWTLNRVNGVHCSITWRERGGPALKSVPRDSGFGSTLLKRIVPKSLEGSATSSYDRTGFSWQLDFPVGAEAVKA